MVFGRGGGGGVINRVTKEAGFSPIREFTLTGGSSRNRRVTGDVDQPFGQRAAFRLNGIYENSDSFRKYVGLQRTALNPTFTFLPDSKTHVTVAYEFLRDRRTADRGITSFQGRPVDVPISTFYGDSANSHVRADVNIVSGTIDRVFGDLIFRNRTVYGDYDRFYQNYVPGAVNTAKTLVALTAYNNATRRGNFFNQTDLNYTLKTGSVRHTLAFGTEFGNQRTVNFRNTGFFNNTSTSIQIPFDTPQTNVPVTFRQSATDADNRLRLNLGAAYVQDQIELSRYVQVVAGVRYDYFDLKYHNNRDGQELTRIDKLVSPRFGLVLKPVTALSIYGSYSVSYLPSSGDQFSSLTAVTQQVKPEKFTNFEAGVKWDIRRDLSLTTAVYKLDRTNTRSTDPNDPTRIIQTGSQRSSGFEAGLTGTILPRWSVSGGYAYQNARITSTTTAAIAGKQVGQVPHNTFSLWNKYQLTSRLGAGLGLIYRSYMFATVDNTVTLPGYLKADAAVFYNFNEHWRLQANLENVTNVRYYANADSNTNISPGAPRGVKVGLVARF
jgi:catecholate siderophore receptor